MLITVSFKFRIKNRSSPGPDLIQSKILKLIRPHICKVLVYLINLSYDTCTFPSNFKASTELITKL